MFHPDLPRQLAVKDTYIFKRGHSYVAKEDDEVGNGMGKDSNLID